MRRQRDIGLSTCCGGMVQCQSPWKRCPRGGEEHRWRVRATRADATRGTRPPARPERCRARRAEALAIDSPPHTTVIPDTITG
jgi:hypothetical protein